jgi:hypothetical protein
LLPFNLYRIETPLAPSGGRYRLSNLAMLAVVDLGDVECLLPVIDQQSSRHTCSNLYNTELPLATELPSNLVVTQAHRHAPLNQQSSCFTLAPPRVPAWRSPVPSR